MTNNIYHGKGRSFPSAFGRSNSGKQFKLGTIPIVRVYENGKKSSPNNYEEINVGTAPKKFKHRKSGSDDSKDIRTEVSPQKTNRDEYISAIFPKAKGRSLKPDEVFDFVEAAIKDQIRKGNPFFDNREFRWAQNHISESSKECSPHRKYNYTQALQALKAGVLRVEEASCSVSAV